jgi:hypothetical protein
MWDASEAQGVDETGCALERTSISKGATVSGRIESITDMRLGCGHAVRGWNI